MAGTVITIKEKEKYRLQYTYKSKRHSKYIFAKNKKEIDTQLSEFITDIRGSNVKKNDVNFSVYCQSWLDTHSNNISHKTRSFYKQMLNTNVLPYFATYKISEINFLEITNFFKKMNNSYAKKTMIHYKNMLNLIFTSAIKLSIITINPVQYLDVPNGTKNTKSNGVYSPGEAKALLTALESEDVKHRLFVDLALKCGMRKGEILGLKWNNINLKKKELYINESVSYSAEFGHEKIDPKTKKSIRYINIPKTTLELLKEYKIRSKDEYLFTEKYDTFTQWFRRFINRENKIFKKEQIKLGIIDADKHIKFQHLTIHGLRHTNATALISSNKIDISAVSARLGHSQTSTTMNIYAHALKEKDKVATRIIDDIF